MDSTKMCHVLLLEIEISYVHTCFTHRWVPAWLTQRTLSIDFVTGRPVLTLTTRPITVQSVGTILTG